MERSLRRTALLAVAASVPAWWLGLYTSERFRLLFVQPHMRVTADRPTGLSDRVVFLMWTLLAASLVSVIALLFVPLLS